MQGFGDGKINGKDVSYPHVRVKHYSDESEWFWKEIFFELISILMCLRNYFAELTNI